MRRRQKKKRIAIKGFSLVELQVAMIIAAVFMLIIGTVAHVGHRSYNKLQREAQIYSDLGYGMKMIRNKVRNSKSTLSIVNAPGGDTRWVGNKDVLVVDGGGFGLFQEDKTTKIDLVYVPDLNDLSKRDKIFTIEAGGDDKNDIIFTRVNDTIKVKNIEGIKDDIPFSLPDVSILRRAS